MECLLLRFHLFFASGRSDDAAHPIAPLTTQSWRDTMYTNMNSNSMTNLRYVAIEGLHLAIRVKQRGDSDTKAVDVRPLGSS